MNEPTANRFFFFSPVFLPHIFSNTRTIQSGSVERARERRARKRHARIFVRPAANGRICCLIFFLIFFFPRFEKKTVNTARYAQFVLVGHRHEYRACISIAHDLKTYSASEREASRESLRSSSKKIAAPRGEPNAGIVRSLPSGRRRPEVLFFAPSEKTQKPRARKVRRCGSDGYASFERCRAAAPNTKTR